MNSEFSPVYGATAREAPAAEEMIDVPLYAPQIDGGAAVDDTTGLDLGYDYDPASYQGMYYQDEDGNYYYYQDVNEDGTAALNGATNPQTVLESYENEDWKPKHFGFFIDIIVDTFYSKAFKVYLTLLLYSAAVLIVCLGLDYSFAMLFRLCAPPKASADPYLQGLGYLGTFFFLSFIFVSAICLMMDMTRNVWCGERGDISFWSATPFEKLPPYPIYGIIIITTLFLPFFWGIVEAAVDNQSILYAAQRFSNVAVLVTVFLVGFCYIWAYWRALVYKRSAIVKIKERDEFLLRTKAYKHHPENLTKIHWYHASTILEEFGFDGKTLRYNSLVFTVGCIPIFALYGAQTLATYSGNPSVVWGLIASLIAISIYTVSWVSVLHRRPQWATYLSAILIVLLVVLSAIGAAVGGGAGIIITLGAFIVSHGMVTRKRAHRLSAKEAQAVVPTRPTTEDVDPIKPWDTYFCCCRNAMLDWIRCWEWSSYFKVTHPKIRRHERDYAMHRMALRTDQKVLLLWWVGVTFAVAFVVALGNAAIYHFDTTIAVRSGAPIVGSDSNNMICTPSYNTNSNSGPFHLLDLALLSTLSYTYGSNGNTDFTSWFSWAPSFIRQYPIELPDTYNEATDGISVPFSHYVDTATNYHIITLNANTRGLSFFRDIDEWGESIMLQIAGVLAPIISIWPEQYKRNFISTSAFVKKAYPSSTALDSVSSYLSGLLESVPSEQILLVGDRFNGGYIKKLSQSFDVQYVVFNPPGVGYMTSDVLNGTQVSARRSITSFIDNLEDSTQTFYVSCSSTLSSNMCSSITTMVAYLTQTCGDVYGRGIA